MDWDKEGPQAAPVKRPSVRAEFTDPIRDEPCALIIPPGGQVYPGAGEERIGVAHPRCAVLADLEMALDAFYCPPHRGGCGWNGRISGAWAADMIKGAR